MKSEFEKDGYIVLKGVFKDSDLDPIRALTDRIITYGEKNLEDPFSSYFLKHRVDQGALYDLFQRHPEFQELAKNEIILNALEELLGEDIFLYENSLVYKPKGKTNEVPWHQDFINRPDEPIKYIAWIALDDVNIANGALKVVPGSHKEGFLDWYTVPGETHHTRVKTDHLDLDTAVHVELAAGDVLIFHQLLLHGSDRVDVHEPRRAYRISYQGFDQIFTPRGVPIVLRGGSPEALTSKFPARQDDIRPAEEVKKSILRRIINRVGRKLTEI